MNGRRGTGLTFLDVVVLAFVCLGLLGVVGPVVSNARSVATYEKCGSQLRRIGQAMLLYAQSHRGSYPRTRWDPQVRRTNAYTGWSAADPFAPDGPGVNDVTAALFLLVRTQNLETDAFVCPSTRQRPWDFGGPGGTGRRRSNFPSNVNLSYSIASPYPDVAAVEAGYKWDYSLSAEFALGADMNPGSPELLNVTWQSSTREMRRANTFNHANRMQQLVLYGDGHVETQQNPFVGVQRDNIYTSGAGGPQKYPPQSTASAAIGGPPDGPNDSVLLPVATIDPHTLGPPDLSVPRERGFGFYLPYALVLLGAAGVAVWSLRRSRRERGSAEPENEAFDSGT